MSNLQEIADDIDFRRSEAIRYEREELRKWAMEQAIRCFVILPGSSTYKDSTLQAVDLNQILAYADRIINYVKKDV